MTNCEEIYHLFYDNAAEHIYTHTYNLNMRDWYTAIANTILLRDKRNTKNADVMNEKFWKTHQCTVRTRNNQALCIEFFHNLEGFYQYTLVLLI